MSEGSARFPRWLSPPILHAAPQVALRGWSVWRWWLLACALAVLASGAYLANSRVSWALGVQTVSLQLAGAAASPDGFVAQGNGLHLIAAGLPLKAHHRYIYQIDVMRPADDAVDVHVDLFGAGYDDPAHEQVHAIRYGAYPMALRGRLPAGAAPPAQAQLRVFYEGAPGLTVHAIYIAVVSPWRIVLEKLLLLAAVCVAFVALVSTARALLASESTSPSGKVWPLLGFIYLALVIGRFALSLSLPYWSGDEYVYKSIAAGIWAYGSAAAISADQLAHGVDLPNLLYPYLIAPAIGLGENFYVGIRLINALVASSAFFPAYAVVSRWTGRRAALAVAVAAALIPSVNIAAYAVTEVLYHPVSLWALWLALLAAERPSGVARHAALGAMVGVALSVRLTAVAILPAYVLALFLIAAREARLKELLLRPGWLAAPVAAAIVHGLLRVLLPGPEVEGLGVYESQSGGWLASAIQSLGRDPRGVVALVAGHLTILAMPYAIGVAAAAAILMRSGSRGDGTAVQRDITIFTVTFSAAVALALVFTLGVSSTDLGGLERWHSRYYFPYLPILLGCVLAFSTGSNNSRGSIAAYVLVLGVTWLGATWFLTQFNGLQQVWFGSTVDSMEVHWMTGAGRAIVLSVLLLGLPLLGVLLWRAGPTVPLAGVAVWLVVAVTGSWAVLQRTPGADDPHCGEAVHHWLRENPGTVAVVAGSRADLVDLVFWLPELPVQSRSLPEGLSQVEAKDLAATDYIAVAGKVEIAGVQPVFNNGNCRILTNQ